MKISALKIGLAVVVIGMIWVSVVFNETEKNHESIVLEKSNSIESKLEFGDTNSDKMIVPGFMILLGSLLIMLMSYLKIKNYNIEQPDENIT